MTRFTLISLCLAVFACDPTQPETETTKPVCVPPPATPEPLQINFLWNDTGLLSRSAFADACARFSDLGVACGEVKTVGEANVIVDTYYDPAGCFDNSRLYAKNDFGVNLPTIAVFWNCMPEEGRGEWLRGVFTKTIAGLFGIEGIPAFCGESSFAYTVNEPGFSGPYYTALTETDLVAWAYRPHSGSVIGPKNEPNYCGPEIRQLDSACARPVVEKTYTVKLWVEDTMKDAAGAGCALWNAFDVVCVETEKDAADVHIYQAEQAANAPIGFTAFNYDNEKWEIFIIRSGDNYLRKMAVAHEIGHTFGVQHVPWWCAKTVMGAYFNQVNCLTEGDYRAWLERYSPFSLAP